MRIVRLVLAMLLPIFLLVINTSCASKERRYLAIDASIISKGQSKEFVLSKLGAPDATRIRGEGEEWYYYHKDRPFYAKIPYIGEKIGYERVEALMIKFNRDIVEEVIFYLPKER